MLHAIAGPALAVLLSVPPSTVTVTEACFDSAAQFNEWSGRYYLAPEPEKIACSLPFGSSLYEDPSARSPLAHFYAAVLRQNPSLPGELFARASGNDGERLLVLHAFRIMSTDETAQLIARAKESWRSPDIDRFFEGLESYEPLDPLERPLDDASALDDLWATFGATGDDRLVGRIASVVHLQYEGHGSEIILGAAARWSLRSMVERHARVRTAVEKLAADAEGVTKKLLEEMLAPPRSGDFD